MAQRRWEDLTESELERLLVEHWLYRGGVLGMALIFAVLVTMLASQGVTELADQVLAGVFVAFALLSAGVFVYLRQQDREIFRLLQERRRRTTDT